MTYKQAQMQVSAEIAKTTNPQIRQLVALYADAHGYLKAELNRLYAPLAGVKAEEWMATLSRIGLMTDVMAGFGRKYSEIAKQAEAQTVNLITGSMAGSYYMTEYIHDFFLGGVNKTFLPKAIIDACVTGKEESIRMVTANIVEKYGSLDNYIPKYGTLSKLIADRNVEGYNAIYGAVEQAIRKGDGIRTLSENITTLFDTSIGKATRIANTEALRVSSAGQYAYSKDLADQGIVAKRMWIHVMTTGVGARPSHAHYDGHSVEEGKPFIINGKSAMYPRGFGDPAEDCNCRCASINIIDGVSPSLRTGTNPVTGEKEIFSFKSYDEWAKEKGISAA